MSRFATHFHHTFELHSMPGITDCLSKKMLVLPFQDFERGYNLPRQNYFLINHLQYTYEFIDLWKLISCLHYQILWKVRH